MITKDSNRADKLIVKGLYFVCLFLFVVDIMIFVESIGWKNLILLSVLIVMGFYLVSAIKRTEDL